MPDISSAPLPNSLAATSVPLQEPPEHQASPLRNSVLNSAKYSSTDSSTEHRLDSSTEVALEQIAAVRKAQPAGAPRPVVTLDSGYDLETLARANLDADLLVRLAKKRVVYRAPVAVSWPRTAAPA